MKAIHILRSLVAASALLAASKAIAAPPAVATVTNTPLVLRTVLRTQMSGITNELRAVATSQAELTALWNELMAGGRSVGGMPAVNFAHETLVLAAMGRQTTGGYSIEITKAVKQGEQVVVTVKSKIPPEGTAKMMVITAPVHAVVIPLAGVGVDFREERAILNMQPGRTNQFGNPGQRKRPVTPK